MVKAKNVTSFYINKAQKNFCLKSQKQPFMPANNQLHMFLGFPLNNLKGTRSEKYMLFTHKLTTCRRKIPYFQQ